MSEIPSSDLNYYTNTDPNKLIEHIYKGTELNSNDSAESKSFDHELNIAVENQFTDSRRAIVELILNGWDAQNRLSITKIPACNLNIFCNVNNEIEEIEVKDEGIGMLPEDVVNFLLSPNISRSDTETYEDLEKEKIHGRFGVGFLANLKYLKEEGDELNIKTSKLVQENGEEVLRTTNIQICPNPDKRSKSKYKYSFSSEVADEADQGTTIKIHSNAFKAQRFENLEEYLFDRFEFKTNADLKINRFSNNEKIGEKNLSLEQGKFKEISTEKVQYKGIENTLILSKLIKETPENQTNITLTLNGVKIKEYKIETPGFDGNYIIELPKNTSITRSRDDIKVDFNISSLFADWLDKVMNSQIGIEEKAEFINVTYEAVKQLSRSYIDNSKSKNPQSLFEGKLGGCIDYVVDKPLPLTEDYNDELKKHSKFLIHPDLIDFDSYPKETKNETYLMLNLGRELPLIISKNFLILNSGSNADVTKIIDPQDNFTLSILKEVQDVYRKSLINGARFSLNSYDFGIFTTDLEHSDFPSDEIQEFFIKLELERNNSNKLEEFFKDNPKSLTLISRLYGLINQNESSGFIKMMLVEIYKDLKKRIDDHSDKEAMNYLWNIYNISKINRSLVDSWNRVSLPLTERKNVFSETKLSEEAIAVFKKYFPFKKSNYDGLLTEDIIYFIEKNLKKEENITKVCGFLSNFLYERSDRFEFNILEFLYDEEDFEGFIKLIELAKEPKLQQIIPEFLNEFRVNSFIYKRGIKYSDFGDKLLTYFNHLLKYSYSDLVDLDGGDLGKYHSYKDDHPLAKIFNNILRSEVISEKDNVIEDSTNISIESLYNLASLYIDLDKEKDDVENVNLRRKIKLFASRINKLTEQSTSPNADIREALQNSINAAIQSGTRKVDIITNRLHLSRKGLIEDLYEIQFINQGTISIENFVKNFFGINESGWNSESSRGFFGQGLYSYFRDTKYVVFDFTDGKTAYKLTIEPQIINGFKTLKVIDIEASEKTRELNETKVSLIYKDDPNFMNSIHSAAVENFVGNINPDEVSIMFNDNLINEPITILESDENGLTIYKSANLSQVTYRGIKVKSSRDLLSAYVPESLIASLNKAKISIGLPNTAKLLDSRDGIVDEGELIEKSLPFLQKFLLQEYCRNSLAQGLPSSKIPYDIFERAEVYKLGSLGLPKELKAAQEAFNKEKYVDLNKFDDTELLLLSMQLTPFGEYKNFFELKEAVESKKSVDFVEDKFRLAMYRMLNNHKNHKESISTDINESEVVIDMNKLEADDVFKFLEIVCQRLFPYLNNGRFSELKFLYANANKAAHATRMGEIAFNLRAFNESYIQNLIKNLNTDNSEQNPISYLLEVFTHEQSHVEESTNKTHDIGFYKRQKNIIDRVLLNVGEIKKVLSSLREISNNYSIKNTALELAEKYRAM